MITEVHLHDQKVFKIKSVSSAIKSTLIGAFLVSSGQVNAANFELDNGVSIDLDTQISYAAQWRMEKQDKTLLDPAANGLLAWNGEDGNLAFDKNDMTQNRLAFSSDLDIAIDNDSFSGGVFVRARGWYDDAYSGDTASAMNLTCNRPDCSTFDNNDGIEDYHKSRVEILDAFLYSNFTVGDQDASLRIGSQVVSWGESLALNGGISLAQGPLDASKSNIPGVELKEIFMPVGQVYLETGLTDNFALGAYYQYDWERTRIDAPGTYFGVDILGEGASDSKLVVPVPGVGLVPAIDVDRSEEPDGGSYGVALRYLADEGTEYGLYVLNYDDTLPTFELLAPTGPLLLKSFEDIDLYGASFGTVLGDTNVSGEISYRDGHPVQLNVPGAYVFAPAQTVQAQVSWLHIFGASFLADNITFMGEIGYNEVVDIDSTFETDTLGEIPAIALGVDVNDKKSALDNDVSAAGYFMKVTADYFSVLPALDMKLSASIKHDFDGTSSVLFTFTEDVMNVGVGADFTYQGVYQFGVKYAAFLTDPEDIVDDGKPLELAHQFADRDNISMYLKYSF
ncbi:DUF1302 family protein [Thalassotalea psychrophila]|uniref:DUF1302 family protein n=1 Tax=Thalassotalea psychrophila TaxID=3065647 RepID=A0ABY9TRT1_9GAMM|nr:DUF1302 family protein [Colwelliaceae bacterium SQ149]